MKKLWIACLILLGFFSFAFFNPENAKANVNNFVINHFQGDYVIDNSVVGGSLETYEEIKVTFSAQNHGLLRAIPAKHNTFDTKLEVRGVTRNDVNEPFTTYKQNGNLVIKIGNPNKTITGPQKYNIYYYQERVINFKDGQEFYWDINGNGWDQPFEKVSATVKLKQGEFNSRTPICYTGYQGSRESDCNFTAQSANQVSFQTTEPLLAKQGMTIGLSVTGVNFVQPTAKDKFKDYLPDLLWALVGVSASLFAFKYWYKQGRDHPGRGVFVPEYEAPKNLTPAEVGMLADYRIDGKDLSATLIDLAVRGYIRIHQETKRFLFAKSQSFKLELLNADQTKLKEHEKSLLNAIFSQNQAGEIIDIKKIKKTKMSLSVSGIRQQIKDDLIKKHGLIDEKSDKSQGWFVIAGFLLGIFTVIPLSGFLPTGLRVGLAITATITFILGFLMQRRTHAGQDIYEKIKGLQMYMNVAEKDRLKMMQSVDRPYAEPAKTAELFEKLLPFAVALGVEKSWAKQFDGILTEQPKWINSNSATAFSTAHLASSLGTVSTNFSSSFETSSGASGGSSGGGGGGGGGGGW